MKQIMFDLEEFVPHYAPLKETLTILKYLSLYNKTKDFKYNNIRKFNKI